MRAVVQVEILASEAIREAPDTWTGSALRELLARLVDEEGGAWTDAEVPELLTMALQDLPPDEAGEAVLAFLIGDRTTRGQRDHMTIELGTGRAWERHSEMVNHLALFEAAGVLHTAHPRSFTPPVATQLTLSLTATDDPGRALLAESPDPAVLCRLLAAGAREGILYRLFDAALDGPSFPEAPHVAWRIQALERTGDTVVVQVVGSYQWFGGLEPGATWAAETWPNAPLADTRR